MDDKWARRLVHALEHKRNPNQRRNRRLLYMLYLATLAVGGWALLRGSES